MKPVKNLPRPTIEILNEYDSLSEQTRHGDLTAQQEEHLFGRLNDIIDAYDLNNYVFDDPATGKKGLKNPAGQILVPARYDSFSFVGDHDFFSIVHAAVCKDGKWGIVAADGTDTLLCPFRFDYLQWNPYIGMYMARWDGNTDLFGLVNKKGEVFMPNVLTKVYEPYNDFVLLESNGKYGALDVATYNFVLPQYDDVDVYADTDVIFHKDGIEGYVVEENGEFVPWEQFEEDEKYADAYVYNTYINV